MFCPNCDKILLSHSLRLNFKTKNLLHINCCNSTESIDIKISGLMLKKILNDLTNTTMYDEYVRNMTFNDFSVYKLNVLPEKFFDLLLEKKQISLSVKEFYKYKDFLIESVKFKCIQLLNHDALYLYILKMLTERDEKTVFLMLNLRSREIIAEVGQYFDLLENINTELIRKLFSYEFKSITMEHVEKKEFYNSEEYVLEYNDISDKVFSFLVRTGNFDTIKNIKKQISESCEQKIETEKKNKENDLRLIIENDALESFINFSKSSYYGFFPKQYNYNYNIRQYIYSIICKNFKFNEDYIKQSNLEIVKEFLIYYFKNSNEFNNYYVDELFVIQSLKKINDVELENLLIENTYLAFSLILDENYIDRLIIKMLECTDKIYKSVNYYNLRIFSDEKKFDIFQKIEFMYPNLFYEFLNFLNNEELLLNMIKLCHPRYTNSKTICISISRNFKNIKKFLINSDESLNSYIFDFF